MHMNQNFRDSNVKLDLTSRWKRKARLVPPCDPSGFLQVYRSDYYIELQRSSTICLKAPLLMCLLR